MIDRQTAITQIKRVAKLRGAPDPGTPEGQAAVEELIKALVKTADHDIHAYDIVTEILEKSQFFPTPSEIYGQRREKPWKPRLTFKCAACEDTGFRIVDIGNGMTAARRCSCRPIPAPPVPTEKPKRGGMSKASELLPGGSV